MYDPLQNHFAQQNKTVNQSNFGFGKDARKSMELKEIVSKALLDQRRKPWSRQL